MELLQALGINGFVFLQFFIFCFMFIFLSLYVFKPFQEALEKRYEKTKGSVDVAEEYQQKIVELHSHYQDKAREINSHIHEIFKQKKELAQAEHDRIVGQARQESTLQIDQNRKALQDAVKAAESEIMTQAPTLAMSVANKLIGK